MRAFVGIPLPEDLSDRFEDLASGLRLGRAVPAENMHVTLAFLDDQPEEVLAELHEALSAMTLPQPEIAIEGLDLFGGAKPRLLFASVTAHEALTELRRKVRQAVQRVGITLPHERFRPHVTLRRFNRLAPFERDELERFLTLQGGFQWPGFRPEACQMVESLLTQEGAQYEVLASYPLSK
ncbi:2'-5' RNA ligase [Celeribacter neptunius]|uniref:RNA 2',3'-cyclic phosphodiesterase n=2 Tax=Celeribacter neptunius TaxID=588602 RepID=A0A1I3TM74_9RHOB|nr:2'-5' RNA ligase [Celeribacter neptunius]